MKIFCVENRKGAYVDLFLRSASDCKFRTVLIPGDDSDLRFREFKSYYVHHSINSAEFELACFRRYFNIFGLASRSERFLIADSDVLVNIDAGTISDQCARYPNHLIASRGVNCGLVEKQVSPHFSIWSRELLGEFIDFLATEYRTSVASGTEGPRGDPLESNGSVSDMTLLGQFIANRRINFLNTNRLSEGFPYVDHNISMPECENAYFKNFLKIKDIKLRSDNRLCFVDSSDQLIAPAAIHLQGRAKLAASSFQAGNISSARLKLGFLGLARATRNAIR